MIYYEILIHTNVILECFEMYAIILNGLECITSNIDTILIVKCSFENCK